MSRCMDFVFQMIKYLYRETSNIILTPIGLEVTALSLLAGANRSCHEELRKIIFGNPPMSAKAINQLTTNMRNMIAEIRSNIEANIKIHNFIFVSSEFEFIEQYLDNVSFYLDTKVKQLFFLDESLQSYNVIESQVSETTMGRINRVLQNVPTVAHMLVINSSTFHPSVKPPLSTYLDRFVSAMDPEFGYEGTTVPFSITRGQIKYYKNVEFSSVELTYSNFNMNLCLLLPNEGFRPREIFSNLSFPKLLSLFRSFSLANVEVHLPDIKLHMNIDVSYIWQLIGIERIFSKDNADFSNMVKNPKGLRLESLICTSDINISGNFKENCSEKSYNSKKESSPSSSSSVVLKFNRPFIYFITCDTEFQQKVVIFSGVVNSVDDSLELKSELSQ